MPTTLPVGFRVLGIDAGFAAPGWSVVQVGNEGFEVKKAGAIITTGTSAKERKKGKIYKSEDDARRIEEIAGTFRELLCEFDPHIVAIELPTSGAKSAAAIKGMAYAAACVVSVMKAMDFKVYYLTPRANKLTATADRLASKQAMVDAISRQFPNFPWPLKTTGM